MVPPAKKLNTGTELSESQPSTLPVDPSERFTYGPNSADSHDRLTYSPDSVVLLLVGLEEEKMLVHKRYITEHSAFLRTALKDEWLEGQTRTVRLPEERPIVVKVYLDFVYKRTLPTCRATTLIHRASATLMDTLWGRLVDLYLVGERMLDTSVRNAVVDELIRIPSRMVVVSAGNGSFLPTRCVNKAYAETPACSPLRRLLVDLHMSYSSSASLKQHYNSSFVTDLAIALMARAEIRDNPGNFRPAVLWAQNYYLPDSD